MDMTDKQIIELVFENHDEPLSEIAKLRIEKCMIVSKRYLSEHIANTLHDMEINGGDYDKQ